MAYSATNLRCAVNIKNGLRPIFGVNSEYSHPLSCANMLLGGSSNAFKLLFSGSV